MTQLNRRGFTLVEMAIVLLIVALVLGSGLSIVSVQIDQQKFSDTQKALDVAKDALIGFAASTTPPHLPCPDRTAGAGANDGAEDRAGAACAVAEGNLPWVTLGITGLDAWGRRFRYRVTPAFADNATGIRLSSVGTLTVNDNDSAVPDALLAPAVVFSLGKNGWGATSGTGAVIPNPPATNIDELINTDSNNIFLAGKPHDNTAPNGEFDDIVTWLSSPVVIGRVLQAGRTLPP